MLQEKMNAHTGVTFYLSGWYAWDVTLAEGCLKHEWNEVRFPWADSGTICVIGVRLSNEWLSGVRQGAGCLPVFTGPLNRHWQCGHVQDMQVSIIGPPEPESFMESAQS